jgi:hypothetical protein
MPGSGISHENFENIKVGIMKNGKMGISEEFQILEISQ